MPTGVTVERLDQELEAAQSRLARLGGALFELDAAREQGNLSTARFAGLSADRWKASGALLVAVWSWYQGTNEVVSQIVDERHTSKLRPVELNSLWDRLTGLS